MGPETIIVLAGGKSAERFDLHKLQSLGVVIGVNDAAVHVPVDIAVSMDRTWCENRYKVIKEKSVSFFAREQAFINISDRWDKLHLFSNDRLSCEMSDTPGVLNGINSGMCALNLAYTMRPKRVVALGFDCSRTGYWYPPYEWQTAPEPRGVTSDWAYEQWKKGIEKVKNQFAMVGIEWI